MCYHEEIKGVANREGNGAAFYIVTWRAHTYKGWSAPGSKAWPIVIEGDDILVSSRRRQRQSRRTDGVIRVYKKIDTIPWGSPGRLPVTLQPWHLVHYTFNHVYGGLSCTETPSVNIDPDGGRL